jgi:hypothetical protein
MWHLMCYGLDNWNLIPNNAKIFSLVHRMLTGSGVQQLSYPLASKGSFPNAEVTGVWNWPLTAT